MAFQPSPYQQAIYNEVATTNHNINVNAVAGSGKTTTLLGCLERIPRGKSIIFMAFNTSIVKELQARNPPPECRYNDVTFLRVAVVVTSVRTHRPDEPE